MNVLAIDQGTSSTKAHVVAPGGEVLGAATAPVSPRAAAGGAVEQDPVTGHPRRRAVRPGPRELPTVVDCDAVIGETQAFGGSLPLSGAVADQQALFAESCFAPGEAAAPWW